MPDTHLAGGRIEHPDRAIGALDGHHRIGAILARQRARRYGCIVAA